MKEEIPLRASKRPPISPSQSSKLYVSRSIRYKFKSNSNVTAICTSSKYSYGLVVSGFIPKIVSSFSVRKPNYTNGVSYSYKFVNCTAFACSFLVLLSTGYQISLDSLTIDLSRYSAD